MKQGPPLIEAIGIGKQFGAFKALDNVALSLPPGSFHALVGENGAGKSTLVKCLTGFYKADAGRILVDGVNLQPGSPKESRRCGIGMVFQHFTLIPSMTVAENLVLPRPDLPLVIDWKTEFTRLREFLKSAPFRVELDSRICTLSAGQKQKVEILKEIYLETRFLILDEPNSVLTPQEAGEVLGLLRCMVDRKELSVLLITHKFREVHAFCQTVTVLRRGRVAGEGKVSQLDSNRMAEMMMGKTGAAHKVGKTAKPGGPLLCLEGLVAMGDTGIEA